MYAGGRLDLRLDPLLELTLRRCADFRGGRLAVLEKDHGRDTTHPIAGRRIRIFIDIDLRDRDLLAEFFGNFLERRANHAARTAPFRPEIDEHRAGRTDDVVMKALVGNGLGGH